MLSGVDPSWATLPDTEHGRAIESAALLLLKFSDKGWEQLFFEHRDDDGHCRSCRTISPCSLLLIALRAQFLSVRRPS